MFTIVRALCRIWRQCCETSLEFLKTFRPRNVIISNLLNLQATAPTSGREHCILNYKQLKLLSLSEVGESDFNFSTFEIITFGRSFQSIFPIFQIFHTVFRLGPVCFNCDLLLLLCLTFFRLQKVLIVCSINCWNNTSGDISEWKLGQIFSFWCFSLTNVLFWVILPFGAFAILMFSYWRFISRLRLDQNCPQDDKDRLHVLNAVNSAWLTTPIFQSMFTFLYDLWLSNISAMIEQWSPMNNFSLDWEITGQHFGLNFLLTISILFRLCPCWSLVNCNICIRDLMKSLILMHHFLNDKITWTKWISNSLYLHWWGRGNF